MGVGEAGGPAAPSSGGDCWTEDDEEEEGEEVFGVGHLEGVREK